MTPKGRATRDRIFAASIQLIAEKGYAATKLPDICREAEVSIGNFYHHFRSKSDILLSYVREESELLIEYYATLEDKPRDEALLACVERFFAFYEVKGREFVASFLAMLLTEGSAWLKPEDLAINLIAMDCVERGVASDSLAGPGEPGVAMVLARAIVWDLSCTWCVEGGPPGLPEKAKTRFRELLSLLGSLR